MLEYDFAGREMIVDDNDWGRATLHEGRVIARATSARQEIAIVELVRFGRSLWLRGLAEKNFWPQFAELDEHRYHQLLVWPALFHHPHPTDVLILGGGDYLAAWRVLMRRGVKRVKIADWDKMVGQMVLEHIPAVRQLGVHEDRRADFSEEIDVTEYLPLAGERFDAIIGDLTDVAALQAIVADAFSHIYRILKPGGVFVTQAGELSLAAQPLELLVKAVAAAQEYFQSVWVSGYHIESFGYTQAFLTCWKSRVVEPAVPRKRELAKRFDSAMMSRDRPFYGPAIHRAAFTLDPAIKTALEGLESKG